MGDSYRPAPPRGPRRPRHRPQPSLADRVTFSAGGGDSYRPGGDQTNRQQNNHEFTFTSNRQGPQFPPVQPQDINPPRGPRKNNSRNRGPNGRNGRGHNGAVDSYAPRNNGDRQGSGRPWRPFRKEAPHERALLRVQNKDGPEQVLGVNQGESKFLNPDDLSESEGEMDLEETEDQSDTPAESKPSAPKSARIESSRADGDSVPRWSNPDPYTVLPPPADETAGKKIDFVQLIRKAKKQSSEQSAARNAVAANDDFISFGEEPLRTAEAAGLPARPPNGDRQAPKRKLDASDKSIIDEWMVKPRMNASPWHHIRPKDAARIGRDTPGPDFQKMRILLHKEIVEFYNFVKPSDHIHRVRQNLITNIETAIGNAHPLRCPARLLCFGSFPEKLYLPTADMDLVFVSQSHLDGGSRRLDFDSKRQINQVLRQTGRRLENVGIATSLIVIARARVPIIKFKDRRTGIQVDISFENLSGIVAQDTFRNWKQDWKDEFVYLVALIKQYLVMRNLCDVHTGGLGGFSIICLVVCFLHTWHSRYPNQQESNYGTLFLDFLDFYGNEFDLATQRIVMDPISVVPKGIYGIDGREEKSNGLSIQDPNNSENNISGGSHRAHDVFRLFGDSHARLSERMNKFDPSGNSILDTVMGGDYSSYQRFMTQMRKLAG